MCSRYGIIILSLLIVAGVYSYSFAGWTPEVRISEPGGCWYPQIIAQGDTLHVVYENTSEYDKISYVRSSDLGQNWDDYRVLSDDSCQTVFPRIIRHGSRLMVLWRNIFYYQGLINRNIGYCISNDNGFTWSAPSYVLDQNIEHILYYSASGNGPVVNIILSSQIWPDFIFYSIRSTNFGQSWSEPQEIFRAAQNGTMDMTAYQQTYHFVWSGDFDWQGEWENYYIRSTDGGLTWSVNVPLSDYDDYISMLPSITNNESGHLAFCWNDYKYAPPGYPGDIFLRQSFDGGENWTREDQLTFNHQAERSDVFSYDDTIHVVHEDDRFGFFRRTIYYLCSTDGGMTWSDEYRVENDTSWSINPAVASSNGKVYVIWGDARYDPDNDIYMGVYFTRYEEDVGIEGNGDDILPNDYSLSAYPNPFNSKVVISLNIEKGRETLRGGDIDLGIYDVNGRLVKSLFKGGLLGKGIYNFTWDATDNSGKDVSSGVYFAKTVTPQSLQTLKLIYLK